MIAAALLFLAALIFPALAAAKEWTAEEQRLWKACRNGEIIRLHVVANSDSPRDQAIKLAVRDAVIAAFAPVLSSDQWADCSHLFQVLSNNVSAFQKAAEQRAKELGFSGQITAQAGVLELPSKRYGQVLLPKGSYKALRITLGSGQGQNWWCVLYPQLCLALSASETEKPLWNCSEIFRQWLVLPVQKE